jgi:hypothetical protein
VFNFGWCPSIACIALQRYLMKYLVKAPFPV